MRCNISNQAYQFRIIVCVSLRSLEFLNILISLFVEDDMDMTSRFEIPLTTVHENFPKKFPISMEKIEIRYIE